MRFLANENIPVKSSHFLKEQGHNITHIGEDNPSIKDEEVMSIANKEDRIIITFDRDYGNLIFRDGYNAPGVIYLRLQDYTPTSPGEFLQSLINSDQYVFKGYFTVVSETNIRQRKI